MENASKALLMAGGILVGILILALMVTLFASTTSLSTRYENTKQEEMVQKFNANFTQFAGKYITMHDVITICNFANVNNNKIKNVTVAKSGATFELNKDQIAKDLEDANQKYIELLGGYDIRANIEVVYKLTITEYDPEGLYISKVTISDRRYRITEYDEYDNIIGVPTTIL